MKTDGTDGFIDPIEFRIVLNQDMESSKSTQDSIGQTWRRSVSSK